MRLALREIRSREIPQRSSQRNGETNRRGMPHHQTKIAYGSSAQSFGRSAQELFHGDRGRRRVFDTFSSRSPQLSLARSDSPCEQQHPSVACFESPWRTSRWTISSRGHPRCSARPRCAPLPPRRPAIRPLDSSRVSLIMASLWLPSRLCARSARRARSSASWKTCSARVCPSRASTSRTAPTSTTRARSTRCVRRCSTPG